MRLWVPGSTRGCRGSGIGRRVGRSLRLADQSHLEERLHVRGAESHLNATDDRFRRATFGRSRHAIDIVLTVGRSSASPPVAVDEICRNPRIPASCEHQTDEYPWTTANSSGEFTAAALILSADLASVHSGGARWSGSRGPCHRPFHGPRRCAPSAGRSSLAASHPRRPPAWPRGTE